MANIKKIVNSDNKLIQSGAVIEFTSSELVTLSNALYMYFKEHDINEREKKLKDIIHIASQISQYGHMDEWAVSVLSRSIDSISEACNSLEEAAE